MKKFLSLILCVCMVLSSLNLVCFSKEKVKMKINLSTIEDKTGLGESIVSETNKALKIALDNYFEILEETEAEIKISTVIESLKVIDKKKEAQVKLSAKIINQNGEVISEAKVIGSSGQKLGYIGDVKILISEAVNNATSLLVENLANNLILNTIVESISEGNKITIGLGEKDGLKKGAKIVISRAGQKIAEGEVTSLGLAISTVSLKNITAPVQIKDNVKVIFNPSATVSLKEKPKKSFIKSGLSMLGGIALLTGIIASQKTSQATTTTTTGTGAAASTAASITISANTTSIPADGISTSIITAYVKDSYNVAVADGTPVSFVSSAGMIVIPGGGATATTSSGTASVALMSVNLGSANVYATSGTAISNTITVNFTPPVSSARSIDLTLAANPISISGATGQAHTTVTATVKDINGNLIDGTQNTTRVYFSTNKGNITASALVNANGVATADFYSTSTGTATITATSGSVTSTTSLIINPGPPHNIVVSANPTSIEANGNSSSTITVTVKDISGNLVTDGTKVDFTTTSDVRNGSVTPYGTITPSAYTTSGIATAILITREANGTISKSGTATINATIPVAQPSGVPAPTSAITNSATKVNFVSNVAAYITCSANPANIRGLDKVGNTSVITAVVEDSNHNPVVDGTAVYFTANHGMIEGDGPTVNGVATSTTISGVATATIMTAAGIATDQIGGNPVTQTTAQWIAGGGWNGEVKVTVASGTVNYSPATYTLIFSGPANQNYSSIGPAGITLSGSQMDNATVTVIAHDVNNTPVADGTTVVFTTTKGKIDASATTSGGIAQVTLRTKTTNDEPNVPPGTGTVTALIDTGGYGAIQLTLNFTVI